MRNNDEKRAEKYIKRHRNKRRWLAFALCVSVITGTGTLYMLNKPATAMTEDGASQVGIVLETADNEFEAGLIEQMKMGSSDSQKDSDENIEEAEKATSEDIGASDISGLPGGDSAKEGDVGSREEDLDKIPEDEAVSDSLDADSSGESSVKHSSDSSGSVLASASSETSGSAADSASSSSSDASCMSSSEDTTSASSSASSTEENKEKNTANEIKQISLTATLIDEFGDEIDSDKYTDIELPDFDDELVLNDQDNPPYSDVKVKSGLFKTISYSYLKATIGNKVVTSIKKETVEYEVNEDEASYSSSYEESDSASEDSEAEDDVITKKVTVYSYSTDGVEYTRLTEDTVLNLVYTAGTQTEYVYEDDKVSITAKLQVPGAIPDDAELVITQITDKTEGYNYDAYMDALNDNAQTIADESGFDSASQYTDTNTLMYDIAFWYEGQEIEPAEGAVSVSIEFKNNQLTNELAVFDENDIAVVHLPIKAEVKESSEITSTVEATEISSDDIEVITLSDATAEVNDTEKIEFSEDSFSIFAVTVYQKHEAGTDNFKSVLGDAINFGIVAQALSIGESETNFAVKNVYATKQSGNDLTNPAEQTYIAGAVYGKFQIKGYPAYFIVPPEYVSYISHASGYSNLKFDNAYTTNELNALVDDMMAYVRNASADLASRKDNISLYYDEASQKYFVDTTSLGAGTYYVTLDASKMSLISQSDKLRIYKNSDQTICFNVTASGTIYLQKYSVSTDLGSLIDGATLESSKAYTDVTQSIIWNFINASEVQSSGSVSGVFISGNTYARWVNYSSSSGWLAFPAVQIESGEWHNTYDEVQQISGTAQFQAYKNVDGKEAVVSGFKFSLYKKSGEKDWTLIETVTNDADTPHNVIFDSITYGGDSNNNNALYQYCPEISAVGQSQDFIYKIVESNGATDSSGNSYKADNTVYYAKVTVTSVLQNQYTKSAYYKVSTPVYYTDENCTLKYTENDLPVFNNTTSTGSVGILLHKYLNNANPGDLKFSFTVRVLKADGKLETLTNSLTNDGENITFSFDYNNTYIWNNRIYLVITENEIANDSSSSSIAITRDTNYIVARVDDLGTEKQKVNYYRIAADDVYAQRLEDIKFPDKKIYIDTIAKGSTYYISDTSKAAFYNEGTGNLRIHKMVVNEFGSGFVKKNTGSAMLDNVMFRITNNSTGDYIVFKGFTGKAKDTRIATEYSSSTHKETGKTYTVTYNQSAQWTISGIPSGTYTVDEVADGVTFTYDPYTNSSSAIENQALSRVTQYDVTVDSEEIGCDKYGIGGQNYRKVFSVDLGNHSNTAPNNVRVGSTEIGNPSHTETVQVCNYYSIPIGPIQVSKNFSGGIWNENMQFTFKIEANGYTAYNSEGVGVTLANQPMPTVSEKVDETYITSIVDTVTVTGADATLNADGSYTAVAKFASIPFRYEGIYYYKITEVDTGIDGVQYDKTEYFVKIVVEKKGTTFIKEYSYDNMTHPEKYTADAKVRECFCYLGANVTYAADADFFTVLAQCELYLGEDPDTSTSYNNTFLARYNSGSVYDVAFNNTLTGNLTVTKKWLDSAEKDDSANHTLLSLYIWQKVAGTSDWKVYSKIQLSSKNKWTQTVTGLPITDEKGNKYVYSVKEPDEYVATFSVIYSYEGLDYNANAQDKITVENENCINTGYEMTVGSDGKNYGKVTITNKSIYTNVLPSTGGIGDTPLKKVGSSLILTAVIGFAIYYLLVKRNRRDMN